MRYFEIAKPPVRHILADADPRETAPGQPRNGSIGNRWRAVPVELA